MAEVERPGQDIGSSRLRRKGIDKRLDSEEHRLALQKKIIELYCIFHGYTCPVARLTLCRAWAVKNFAEMVLSPKI